MPTRLLIGQGVIHRPSQLRGTVQSVHPVSGKLRVGFTDGGHGYFPATELRRVASAKAKKRMHPAPPAGNALELIAARAGVSIERLVALANANGLSVGEAAQALME